MRVFFKQIAAAATRNAAMEAENHLKNCAMANFNSENKVSIRLLQKITVAFFIATLSFTAMAMAQDNVTNIRVQQMEHVLVITYDLALRADIEVHVSFDGGTIFMGPLQHLTGEAGRGIEPGANKMIVWNVRDEFGQMDAPNSVIKVVSTNEDASSRIANGRATYQFIAVRTAGVVIGVQFTGAVDIAENVKGAQISVVNIAKEISGVQIGGVNIAKKSNGSVHIGLVNVVEGKFIPIFWAVRKKN